MKTRFRLAAPLFLGLLTPIQAQNFSESPTGVEEQKRPVAANPLADREVPQVGKAQGLPEDHAAVLATQDSRTLEARLPRNRSVESMVDLSVLEDPSPFRNVASGRTTGTETLQVEGVKNDLDRISAVYRESGHPESDCTKLSLAIDQRVKLEDSDVLEIVDRELKANPSCACEIVKSAIKASEADLALVVAIVETSFTAAPESIRMISQCAIATMPDALPEVQKLLAKYDPNAGESGSSAKSAKSSKGAKFASVGPADDVTAMPNPLDFPGNGPTGPTPGGPGGFPLIPPAPPIIITPPFVTIVDP